MNLQFTYSLKGGVQVRREKFGLLFYNYKGPRLYFVPSRDLMEDSFFEGKQTVEELIEAIHERRQWPRQWVHNGIKQILGMLEEKGLIYGKSIC